MPRLILPAVVLAFVLAAPSNAAKKVTEYDRFELWNGCGTVELVVENLPDDAGKLGLRKADIETAVRSRLRAARIYADRAQAVLYVRVSVVSRAHGIDFKFKRRVMVMGFSALAKPEEVGALTGFATTWDEGSTGVHGSDAGFILSAVAQHTDRYIDEYLRVNADACRKLN